MEVTPVLDAPAASRRPSTTEASTGSVLPFTLKGGRDSVAKPWTRARKLSVATTCPSSARPMTRAARLMASPENE